MAGFLLPAATTAGSALMGFLGGKSQEKEARRVEDMNRQLSALDSEMSPFVKTQTAKMAQPERGPGAMGGLFKGALAGASQAMTVNDALNKDNLYKDLLLKKQMQAMNSGGPMDQSMAGYNDNAFKVIG